MIRCVILRCPECGKERPFACTIDPEDPFIKMRCLRLGFGEHYVIAHKEEPSKDLVKKVWASKLVKEVSEELLEEVRRKPKEEKWCYYELFR